MKLELTLACGEYDRTRALQDGTVAPEGINLNYIVMVPGELFRRQAHHAEFDVSEMSLSAFTMLRSRGDDRFIGIPVFPSRSFRHHNIIVNAESGVERPEDLVGKRVGCEEYQMTAAVWIRAILQHEYGVRPRDLDWYIGDQDAPADLDRIPLNLPAEIRLHQVPGGATLSQLLVAGELDAMVTAHLPRCFLDGAPNVRRLFPDFRQVEADYYRRTGFFPIMHTVVVKRTVYERYPWVPQSLYKAFERAKAIGMRRLAYSGALACALPWLIAEVEEARQLMGHDYWPYGIEANRPILEAVSTYVDEQGLAERRVSVEELFAPETFHGVETTGY